MRREPAGLPRLGINGEAVVSALEQLADQWEADANSTDRYDGGSRQSRMLRDLREVLEAHQERDRVKIRGEESMGELDALAEEWKARTCLRH